MIDIVNTLDTGTSVAALIISIAAWRVARQAFHGEHRPLIRVVALPVPQAFVVGGGYHPPQPEAVDRMQMSGVILKNVGRGPGLTVIAFDPDDSALIGDVDVVEPLGAGDEEHTRLGRVTLTLRRPMVMDHTYELYYQDALGNWHLTRFRPRPMVKIECTFVGRVKKIPGEVAVQGTMARP